MKNNNHNNKNLTATLTELHKIFDCLNNEFYKGELPQVIITIQSKGKTNALGWFTPSKIWEDGSEGKHEINITAESLKRDYIDIVRTLHHEMIHLYCHVNEIKDVSRGNTYHNTKFKNVSLEHGFYYKEDAYNNKIGWSASSLTPESIERIHTFNINKDVFKISRAETGTGADKKKKKSNIIKWVCGCGQIIRTSKDGLRCLCLDCETMFIKEDELEGLEQPTGEDTEPQEAEQTGTNTNSSVEDVKPVGEPQEIQEEQGATNKSIIEKYVNAEGYKIGCYSDIMDTITKRQLNKVIEAIKMQSPTDISMNIKKVKYILEIAFVDNEIDFTFKTYEEYKNVYGETGGSF